VSIRSGIGKLKWGERPSSVYRCLFIALVMFIYDHSEVVFILSTSIDLLPLRGIV